MLDVMLKEKTGEHSFIINQNILNEVLLKIRSSQLNINNVPYDRIGINNLNDLVAVHLSAIPPCKDRIVTPENSGKTNNMQFVDPATGVEHVVPYVVGDDTIHFTLNCVVNNHQYGNDWDSYKYGVLVDFTKLDKSKVLDVKSEDTYIDGDAVFKEDYYLFCPLGEREIIAQNNPKATIIEYDGISLKDAISTMIILSGKKLQPYGTYGWGRNQEYQQDSKEIDKLESIVTSAGYPVLKGVFGNMLHSESKYMARRMWKREYEALINLVRYNLEHDIDMPDNIIYMVMVYGGAYSLPGTVPVSIDDYKNVVFPILNKYGYDVDDSLFDGLEIDDDKKYIYDLGNAFGEPTIICPLWENELRKRVIRIIKCHSKKYGSI